MPPSPLLLLSQGKSHSPALDRLHQILSEPSNPDGGASGGGFWLPAGRIGVFAAIPLAISMGCFAVHRAKKNRAEQDDVDDAGTENLSSPASSSTPASLKKETPSFRKTARAIQIAQSFIKHSKPGGDDSAIRAAGSPAEEGAAHGVPMPLPSPRLSPKLTGYALPHPSNQSPPSAFVNNTSAVHVSLNSRVFPWELQPHPPRRNSFVPSKGLKSFSLGEIEIACQHFSPQALVGDDGTCFDGAITVLRKEAKRRQQWQQQEIVILCLHENIHLGVKEWLPELYSVSHPLSSHVCKLIGFYHEDGIRERYVVYERLARGNLHSLLFESSDTRSLDWSVRLKLIQGTVAGLASLEESFPEQALYRDFRLSHIQCDSNYHAKVSGYWFVTSSSQIVQSHVLSHASVARDNAYCAPETRSRGVLTWKSTVWSLGVVLLELLCGRRNNDERMGKDEKHNLLQWARQFLLEEDKLFLIMDPKLQGRFSAKGAKIMANLILLCLQSDPARRPSMKLALEMMKPVKEPLQTNMPVQKSFMHEAPTTMSAPLATSSPKPALLDRNIRSYNRSPTKFDLIQSPLLKPLVIPARYSKN